MNPPQSNRSARVCKPSCCIAAAKHGATEARKRRQSVARRATAQGLKLAAQTLDFDLPLKNPLLLGLGPCLLLVGTFPFGLGAGLLFGGAFPFDLGAGFLLLGARFVLLGALPRGLGALPFRFGAFPFGLGIGLLLVGAFPFGLDTGAHFFGRGEPTRTKRVVKPQLVAVGFQV